MHSSEFHSPSRRTFLRRSGQLALTGTALPFALNLAAMGEAAAFNSSPNDYKALVCVFMFGGNDYGNTVIPYDDLSYDKYHTIRGGGATGQGAAGIAIAKSALVPTLLAPTVPLANPLNPGGASLQYALHPAMTGLANLFNAGKVAVQLNVGPLVKPTTRAQFNSSNRTTNPLPPQLFSHNDQQSIWQSSSPEGSKIGWGGNMGDLVIPAGLNVNSLFTGISVSGNAVFLSGDTALQYQVSTSGAISIRPATAPVYGSTAVQTTLKSLIEKTTGTHKLENDYNTVTDRALRSEAAIRSALALSAATTMPPVSEPAWAARFKTDGLSRQMKMVARLINGRAQLGNRRQVFFVSIGGFDLHDNLIAQHPGILGAVSDAMSTFYQATVDLGIENQVTAFTASDFGRTLASNGDGTDHGWGSHHFVVGGAVNGKAFYGSPPPVSISDTKDSGGNYLPENQWHVGQGRLLPTTSVDQYAATMAKWFGVDPSDMSNVLPNIGNFGGVGYPQDLGFMA